MLRYALAISAITALLLAAQPVLAQSTNAAPILIETGKPLDPATVPMTDDANKTAVTNYIAAAKTAAPFSSVLTTSANFGSTVWYTASASIPGSLADTARVSLELCEFSSKAPCIIVGIDGNDARGPDGAWPAQPEMLVKAPGSKFDAWTIPFNPQFNRAIGGYLAALPFPSVVVISTGVAWSVGSGKTVLEAIDNAFASCTKATPNNQCVLYSVNGTVVMAQ